ncbi:MAG: hypothetical protein ABIL09_27940 [Gemmatimonadota bacterium]
MKANSLLEGGAKRLGALFLLAWALPMVCGGLGLMLWGLFNRIGDNPWQDPLSIGVSLVILGSVLWVLSKRLDAAAQLVRRRRHENRILRLARACGGRLMAIEAAAETGLTAAEAESILRELAEGGYVEIEVTEAGLMVYRFPEVLYGHGKLGRTERLWGAS